MMLTQFFHCHSSRYLHPPAAVAAHLTLFIKIRQPYRLDYQAHNISITCTTRAIGEQRPLPRQIQSGSGVWIESPDPYDFQNLKRLFLSKYIEIYDKLCIKIWSVFRRYEQNCCISRRWRILHKIPGSGHRCGRLPYLISSALSTDTSPAKFSRISDQKFFCEVAKTDKNRTERHTMGKT